MRRVLFFSLFVAITATGIAQTPPRDKVVQSPSIGTATLSGIIVAANEARPPVRRATVTLTRNIPEDVRVTATDEDGRYTFAQLPAGSYTLSATQGPYLPMNFGAPLPGMPGSPVVLREGQVLAVTPIALTRGGVIAGRLSDRTGQPAADVSIEAVQVISLGGQLRQRTSARGTRVLTNSHGEYRIFGLPPGDFVVTARGNSTAVKDSASAAEFAWVTQQLGTAPPSARSFVNAPTVFPGATSEASASVIRLAPGEERVGVDFAIQSVPVANVSGTVMGLDGRPPSEFGVSFIARDPYALLPPSSLLTCAVSPGDAGFTC